MVTVKELGNRDGVLITLKGIYVLTLEYNVHVLTKTCQCVQFRKKLVCKHLLAAFCKIGRHADLHVQDVNQLSGTELLINGRRPNLNTGRYNQGVRQTVTTRIL